MRSKIFFLLTISAGFFIGCKRQYLGVNPLRSVVPITVQYNPANGEATPSIQIQIGDNDSTVQVLFDTGSWGLRILKGAVSQSYYQTTNTWINYSYGTEPKILGISGFVAKAFMTIGNLRTSVPIAFMAIDSTQYDPGGPWTSTDDSARISSGHFKHIAGILGVGMRYKSSGQSVASPLAQLPGNAKYIVQLPYYGGTSGSLIINPTPEDLQGFILFHLLPGSDNLPGGLNSWDDTILSGCFIINGIYYWAGTLLDTGNPEMEIQSPFFNGNTSASPADKIEFGLANQLYDSLNLRIQTAFIVTNPDTAGINRIALLNYSTAMNFPAIMPFFKYDVLYDQTDGIIGLRSK